MLHRLSRVLDFTENVLAYIGGILLAISTITVVMEVISRYLFNYSFLWVNEISEYILLYIPFLGGAWLLRSNGHITVDILEELMSSRLRFLSDILIAIVGILICIIIVWYGTLTTFDVLYRDVRSLTTLQIPQVYVMAIIPLGTFILMLEFIRKLYRTILMKKSINKIDTITTSL
ncbi:TRAP transporter small permease [Mesobacillus selenatarsenatis]|uniref:TRAP transporter small permease n=1 Tax=Mesobacillus selenatarsenatis TaxID=388741 RepID=UPI0005A63855|nr:TRAP transporter small permease [Mesobacillus selenatarsenatis]